MKRAWITPVSVLAAALLVCGCDAIHRIGGHGNRERVVEVAMFEGGYGVQWHKKMAARYSAAHRADHIRIYLWGDQRSDEIVKPRIMRGDPPAIVDSGGLPVWRLVADHKLLPFDKVLNEPAYGSTKKWRDLFIPGTLDMYTTHGHVYAIPSAFGVWGCWYDARMFRRHGWRVPKTWRQFTALCRTIRAAGIAPIAFQGKYPTYAWWTFVTLIQRCGGVAALNRINALEPGAFTAPSVVWAARLVQEMAKNYFQKGALAMTHTESQLQFVNGKAALIFCGAWLENEEKDVTPPDFEMRCFNVPAVEGGKGNPKAYDGEGGEFFFALADGKHAKLGEDFVRYLVSPLNAPDMARSIDVISPLEGATPRDSLTPAMQSVLDIMKQAPGIFSVRLPELLLKWSNEVMRPDMAALLSGELTPERFCRRLDRGAQQAKRDPNVIIPPAKLLDPKKFGESG